MRNRIKEFREARGWSLEQMSIRLGEPTTPSTIHKLETGAMRLTTDWLAKLGAAFGVHPVDLIDDRVPSRLSDDVTSLRSDAVTPGLAASAATKGHALYRVLNACLDEVGVLAGDIVEVDVAKVRLDEIATGDILIVDVATGGPGEFAKLLREFVEPALLITNSRSNNSVPINMKSTMARVIGTVVSAHRRLARARTASE